MYTKIVIGSAACNVRVLSDMRDLATQTLISRQCDRKNSAACVHFI